MNIKIGKYNLAGDDWNEKISDFKPSTTRDVTVQKHFRARYPKLRDSGNELTTITFTVARLHDDYQTARKFQLDHPRNLPRSGVVTIEDALEGGIVRRVFTQAFITSFDLDMIGVTTRNSYQIIGTELTTP